MTPKTGLGKSGDFLLLPYPRQLTPLAGAVDLTDQSRRLIVIATPALLFTAQRLQTTLAAIDVHWEIVAASDSLPAEQISIKLSLKSPTESITSDKKAYQEQWRTLQPDNLGLVASNEYITGPREYTRRDKPAYQEYSLFIDPTAQRPILIEGYSEAAIWYGVCTLRQLIRQLTVGQPLPAQRIIDSPDFVRRGVMLDISRDKVPTMDTLYTLIDRLAGWKINEVQLYTEHTFAYRKHPIVWKNASPITAQEIMELDQFCKERFIDLVPNQNSFGHMHRWLMHDEYRDLAEYPDGFDWPMFLTPRPFSLAANDPRSIALIKDMYDELLPNFTSRYFNIGCDETFDLGLGRSKDVVDANGSGRVYLEYLTKAANLVKAHDRTPMFWGDIIVQHPELIPEIPKGLIAMEWGYEANHPFDKDGAQFAASKIPFYVCPGTSSWISLVGRTTNAIGNLQNAADNGIKYGAIGHLNTDWGDLGHLQTLPASYLGFAYGAATAWANDANRNIDLPVVLSRFAFEDPTGLMGQIAYDAGNLYLTLSEVPHGNGAAMVRALFSNMDALRGHQWLRGSKAPPTEFDPAHLHVAIAAMDEQIDKLAESAPIDPRVRDEYQASMRLWQHGCKRLLMAEGDTTYTNRQMAAELRELREQYQINWLSRNRPGGLSDSLARIDRLFADYAYEAEMSRP